MKELLNQLGVVPAVSSHEEAFRRCLKDILALHVDSMREDALGNLIVTRTGKRTPSRKLVIDVPMDENGVMVSGFTDWGFVRFQTVGAVDRRTLVGKRVKMGENGLPGVIGMKPIHLSSREERKSVPKTDDLYIDIGAADRKDAESKLALGDVGWFTTEGGVFGKNLWKGKSLNSKIPCALAIQLLREKVFPVNCTIVFSAQELVGTRGAYGAAFSERPDVVLCLNGVPACDDPLTSAEEQETKLTKGVVLPVSDRFTQYDRTLFEQLRTLAQTNHLPWQIQAKSSVTGAARAYQRSRGGVRTVGLGLPLRYLHSPVEVASLDDAEAMLTLTRLFLENFD